MNNKDMHKLYEEKIALFRLKETKLKRKSTFYLYIKLLSFSAIVFFLYVTYKNLNIFSASTVVFFLVIYIASRIKDNKCIKNIKILNNMKSVCKKELCYLNGDFTPFNTGENYINIQHEFSYDLDLFGPSSLFNRINRTITRDGRDKLADKLTHLSQDKKEINSNQAAIGELKVLFDWRIKFLANPTIENNLDIFSGLILNNKKKNRLIYSTLPYISIALTLGFLISGIFGIISFYYFLGMFCTQFLISVLLSKTSEKINTNTEKLHKKYSGYLDILNDINNVEFKSDVLCKLKNELFGEKFNSLKSFKELSQILNLFEHRVNAITYVILNGTVLYDILLIRIFLKWEKEYLPYTRKWINCLTEIDALVSLGTYAFNNPQNTLAQVQDDNCENVIQAVNVYHPFLSHEKAVPNSFILKKSNIDIITGANMAGKSTFLRTIGITYILASIGVPVCAESFKFSIVSLFSSMRTTDNLSKDISYFNAELIRLKQLIEHIKSHSFTLIILDEILKGTNSKDKLKGSIMFLNEISKYNISAIIATHDLELAKLGEKDSSVYLNYCFEIELAKKINYSYKIQKGVAQNLNASYLLSNILKDL